MTLPSLLRSDRLSEALPELRAGLAIIAKDKMFSSNIDTMGAILETLIRLIEERGDSHA